MVEAVARSLAALVWSVRFLVALACASASSVRSRSAVLVSVVNCCASIVMWFGGIGCVGETAKTVEDLVKDHAELIRFRNELGVKHKIQKPFYPSEVVWLLNERGVVLFLQGCLFDALKNIAIDRMSGL